MHILLHPIFIIQKKTYHIDIKSSNKIQSRINQYTTKKNTNSTLLCNTQISKYNKKNINKKKQINIKNEQKPTLKGV